MVHAWALQGQKPSLVGVHRAEESTGILVKGSLNTQDDATSDSMRLFCETHSHGPLCSPNGANPEAVCRHGLPKSKTCKHQYITVQFDGQFLRIVSTYIQRVTTASHPARKKQLANRQTANTFPTLQTQTFFTCTSRSTGIHWNAFTTYPLTNCH